MKLDYIADGSDDCPLIRLSEFDRQEAAGLRAVAQRLADGQDTSVCVHGLPGVDSSGHCQLVFEVGETDQGIEVPAAAGPFRCVLTQDGWAGLAGLIEPFVERLTGYQWLNENGNVSLLLSPGGEW